ncbi:hypothetical protein H6G97_44445 [Nostoc flagelliforme FACHB-838]|uniref:Uncharacterized protein n=1 Tax=Nostoc flagelliforme FACHB-838 TaxID=2692904 RepID=A0ABR8E352_9NOSO|nr:hypothetical protein [Nostoc flagelliforme FACHB-838]
MKLPNGPQIPALVQMLRWITGLMRKAPVIHVGDIRALAELRDGLTPRRSRRQSYLLTRLPSQISKKQTK